MNGLFLMICYANYVISQNASEEFNFTGPILLQSTNLLYTFINFYEEYVVSFEINPISIYRSLYGNVIHLTANGDYINYGDRNPAVFFCPVVPQQGLFSVSTSINGSVQNFYTKSLPLNQWSLVEILQEFVDSNFVYSISINKTKIYSSVNNQTIQLSNVKLYASNPWHNAQNGYIRNLYVFTSKTDPLTVIPSTQFSTDPVTILPSTQYPTVVSGCTNDSSTDFQLTATGYLVENIFFCVSVCNSFKPPGVFRYAFFLEGEFCFCRNASLPELDITKFNSPCVKSTCLSNNNSLDCFLSSYDVMLLSSGIVEWSVTYNPANVVVGNEVQIKANILGDDASSAFMRPIPSDISSVVQIVNSTTMKTHFYLPGLQEWCAEIGNDFTEPFTAVSWIQVSEYIDGIQMIPATVQTNGVSFLIITEGTNISVSLSIQMAQNINFSADIIQLMFGSSFLYNKSLQVCSLSHGFTLKQILVSGRFSKVKLNSVSKGYIHIAILRPLCKSSTDICPSSFHCTNTCFRKMLLEASNSSTITALVVYRFVFLLNDTGVIEIPIRNKFNEILDNDMIWIGGNTSLLCNETVSKSIQDLGAMIANTVTFLANTISNIDFFISIFISKPFEYLVPLPSSSGLFNITVNASNNIPSFQQFTFSLNNQIPVSNLNFADMKPFSNFIAGYKVDSWIPFKAVIDNGTDVIYMFNIPKLNFTAIVSNGEVSFKPVSSGVFTVYLTAGNKLNTLNTSIDIAVLSEINGLSLAVDKSLTKDVAFITNVTIFNGTNVLLVVDFGDGSPVIKKENIDATGVNGLFFPIAYKYSVCRVFTINVFVGNTFANGFKTVNKSLSKSTSVTVFCPLSPLNISTMPINSSNGNVLLSLNKTIIINVHQYSGSYMLYSIDWGDGDSILNNQTMNVSPVSFQVQHMYKTENTYNISISCKNYMQSVNYSIMVLVKNCSAPEITFYYGTFLNPMIIMQSIGADLTAIIDNANSFCINKNYSFKWNLTNYSAKPIIAQDAISIETLSQQTITFRIKKKALSVGLYIFSVVFNYGVDTFVYNAFLNVVFSSLYIDIENGLFNSIAYKKKIGNESFHQNFTISAMSSYDPDDPSAEIQNITFKWRCKIAKNFSYAIELMENFTLLNLTYQSDTCFSQHWYNILSLNPYINYSTLQFLEGISYHFEVCGTKYAGKDLDSNDINKTSCFIQELLILAADLPAVTVRCISNCESKLNFKERVIYAFDCENCGSKRLITQWSITDDNNIVPPEIKLSINATTTGFLNPSLVINKDILLESKNYTFTLIVGFADSLKRTKFEFTKVTCSKPTPGYCVINPTEGYALETKFVILCFDWSDSDQLLSYRFYYDNSQSQFMLMSSTTTVDYPLLNAASTYQPSFFYFMMGPGNENNGYNIKIIIKVSGKYRAYTEYNIYIKVYSSNKPLNIKELISGINLNDTQSVAHLVQAVSSTANKMSTNYSVNPPLLINDYTGMAENVLNQEQKISQMQNIRTKMVNLLNNVAISDLNSFKVVADALALTSQYPVELDFQTQNDASNVVIKLAKSFTKENLKGFGADIFDTMTQSFVKSISNLFQASINNITADYSNYPKSSVQTTINLENQKMVSNLLQSMENYFFAVQFYKVSGENSTVGQTNQFTFELKKKILSTLSNNSIGSFAKSGVAVSSEMQVKNYEYGFTLPDSTDMFNESIQNIQVLVNLDVANTSFSITKCKCTHLTAFGGFFVAPNPLFMPTFALFKKGYALTVTVAVVILLWLVGLVLCRRMDKKDLNKVGVCPLLDNQYGDTYLYQIIVNTGSRRNAGTKSNIFFTVVGDLNDSGVRRLRDAERECFQRASCDVFIMTTHNSLGELDFIRLWHDNSGGGWYVKNIIINDLQIKKQFVFIGRRWIAADCGPCTLDCVIPVASVDEQKNFTYVFISKAEQNLFDEHLWFSIFARLPKNTFTRCQRLSVAISLIMTSMMVSAMYYTRVNKEKPEDENKGTFSLSKTQIFVVFLSTCIKIPIHLILLKFFRLKKPLRSLIQHHLTDISLDRENYLEQSPSKSLPENFNSTPNSTSVVIEKANPSLIIKKNYLLNWCLYIAWIICVGNIFICGLVVLWYGMSFGNSKSLNWLAVITIDFAKEIFLTDPIKIFIMAIFFALIVKKINEESDVEKQGVLLVQDKSWLNKLKGVPTIFERKDIELQPLNSTKVQEMQEKRFKELKMHALTNEIVLYTIYAVLVMLIGYMTRENVAYNQTRNVQELFNLTPRGIPWPREYSKIYGKIQSSQDIWLWLEEFFLVQVYPVPWYNLSDAYANKNKKDFPGKLFLNDLTSKIVNGIRIRQIRVKPNTCIKANSVADFTIDCLSPYKTSLEETRDFDLNWTIPKHYNSPIYPSTMPWRYQTWQELDGYPYTANLDTYYGGGYVIEIYPKWKNKAILEQVKKSRWIDRQTRAVIIEFALFNAATNYFSMVTMALEFPASGGVIPNFSVLTFKLYASVTGSKVILGSYFLFILITILFAIRECRYLYQTGPKYFLEFWNLVEVALINLSIIAVVFFFYKGHLAKMLLQRIPQKKPNKFINFQFASYWDLAYIYIVSLIVFFVTLKFIKLLRFNCRMLMLSSTLKNAWYPLTMFGIIFFIILCSVVSTSSIVFGSLLYGYQNYFKTLASIISLLLGKFSYSQFENANNVLGPSFFFGFNFIVIWIVMNIFISILNDAFAEVCADFQFQTNEYEMINFIIVNLKELFGWNPSKKSVDITTNQKVGLREDSSMDCMGLLRKSKLHQFTELNQEKPIINQILKLSNYENLSKKDIDIVEHESLYKFVNCMSAVYESSFALEKKGNKVVE
nr:uncharacterized protein LOC105848477 isoform X3 [Hydra vulgaris]